MKIPVVAAVTSRRRCLLFFCVLILPVVAAIWGVRWFVTQDGPAHIYNAHILVELAKPNAPLAAAFTARLEPVPNLVGQLLLMGLMSIFSARTADRMMMTLVFVGFASSILWLRWQVAGWKGMWLVAPLAVLLGLNKLWLMGFYSFLVGAALFPLTLGFWWSSRERMGLVRALALAGLLVFGYLCHVISFGLTVVGLAVLSLLTPGAGWRRRCAWTFVGLLPLVPLAIMYRSMMRSGGKARPTWDELTDVWSPHLWAKHLLDANPLQFGPLRAFPFVESFSAWYQLLSPTFLVTIALTVLVAAMVIARTSQRRLLADPHRAWWVLAVLFCAGWLIGPDHFGDQHGGFIRERLLLLGLVCIVPALQVDFKRVSAQIGMFAVVVAVAAQTAMVWDYALFSNRLVGDLMQAKEYVGTDQRIKSLIFVNREDSEQHKRFYISPLLNADNMFGADTSNIVWNNYQAIHYYFPVKYRSPRAHESALKTADLRWLNSFGLEERADQHLDEWAELLSGNHHEIDVLVIWGVEPQFDVVQSQWFDSQPIFQRGNVRVFRHRESVTGLKRNVMVEKTG